MPASTKPLFAAFVRACYDSGKGHHELANVGGFKFRSQLGEILASGRARHTELIATRLQKIAEAIGYEGPVFR